MLYAVPTSIRNTFPSLLNSIDLQLQPFNLARCDERTLYIPISLKYAGNEVVCDVIYLVDKIDLFGAISLNNYYNDVRDFFNNHFNYTLMYSDEQQLAKIVSSSPRFQQYLKQFTIRFPKHISNKTFPV